MSSGGGGEVLTGLAAEISSLSPILWLRGDDASGDLTDYGSRGVDAVLTQGAVTYNAVSGPDSTSYVNFSDEDYFQVPDAADLEIDNVTGTTFCVAYRPESFTQRAGSFFSKSDAAGGRSYYIRQRYGVDEIRVLRFQDDDFSVYSEYRIDTNPALNTWHFLIVRFNTDGTTSLWQDTTTEGAVQQTAPTGTAQTDSTAPLTFGSGTGTNSGADVDGTVAHWAIFDSALSDVQCEDLMQAAIDEGWTE